MNDKTPVVGAEQECVHLGWKKSSYSASNGHCVETASLLGRRLIGVRDSRSRQATGGPVLLFRCEAWSAFVAELRASLP
jgi:Domain of unknown function (DUF397)